MVTTVEMPKLLTAAEVSGYLRVSGETLKHWVRDGLLPPPLMKGKGRRRVWLAADIRDCLHRQAGRK
jgi:predicted site-specific integrase-resolvase